jgi:hypothetical protein
MISRKKHLKFFLPDFMRMHVGIYENLHTISETWRVFRVFKVIYKLKWKVELSINPWKILIILKKEIFPRFAAEPPLRWVYVPPQIESNVCFTSRRPSRRL